MNDKFTLAIKAKPGCCRTAIKSFDEDMIYIDVNAVPENNKANNELVSYLSEVFQLPKNKISVVSGKTCHKKIIEIQAVVDNIRSIVEKEMDSS